MTSNSRTQKIQAISRCRDDLFDDTLEQIDDGGDEREIHAECYVFICRATTGVCPDAPTGGCDWCCRVSADDERSTEEILEEVERRH